MVNCKNGPSCRFLKEHRCLFDHEPSHWKFLDLKGAVARIYELERRLAQMFRSLHRRRVRSKVDSSVYQDTVSEQQEPPPNNPSKPPERPPSPGLSSGGAGSGSSSSGPPWSSAVTLSSASQATSQVIASSSAIVATPSFVDVVSTAASSDRRVLRSESRQAKMAAAASSRQLPQPSSTTSKTNTQQTDLVTSAAGARSAPVDRKGAAQSSFNGKKIKLTGVEAPSIFKKIWASVRPEEILPQNESSEFHEDFWAAEAAQHNDGPNPERFDNSTQTMIATLAKEWARAIPVCRKRGINIDRFLQSCFSMFDFVDMDQCDV